MLDYIRLVRVSSVRNANQFDDDQQNAYTAADGEPDVSSNPIGPFKTRTVCRHTGFDVEEKKLQVVVDYNGRVWLDEERFESMFCGD